MQVTTPAAIRKDMEYAIDHQKKVDIRYTDVKGKVTIRTICPTDLFAGTDDHVFGAFCEDRMQFRSFKLHSIKGVKIRRDRFNPEIDFATAE